MGKWLQNKERPWIVDDEDGKRIAECDGEDAAERIVTEHNSHAALLAACKEVNPLLKRLVKTLKYQKPGKEFWPNREEGEGLLDRIAEAIALAEDK